MGQIDITDVKFALTGKGEVDMCQAVKEIREEERQEGRAEGRAEGENRLATLIQKLLAVGRVDDVKKASEAPKVREELMKEFKLA